MARDYLLHHADEEKSHWQWVINDLKRIGYKGGDPRNNLPNPACQTYIAYNVFTAVKDPLSRLAIAFVLETIGATFSKKYAQKVCQLLKLTPNQTSFFFGHGDTDVGHSQEILEIINQCELTEDQWKRMVQAVKVAGNLYKQMYNEVVK